MRPPNPPPLSLLLSNAWAVWGSNTGVGKTLVSAGLARAAVAAGEKCLYLKPCQTGAPRDDDAAFVASASASASSSPFIVHRGPHAAVVYPGGLGLPPPTGPPALLRCSTLFAWERPVSPHRAVELEGEPGLESPRCKRALSSTHTTHTPPLCALDPSSLSRPHLPPAPPP